MKKLLIVAALSMAGTAMANQLHPVCEDYFKQIESLQQVPPAVKAQLEANKQQFATLPAAAQEHACKEALEALKAMFPAK